MIVAARWALVIIWKRQGGNGEWMVAAVGPSFFDRMKRWKIQGMRANGWNLGLKPCCGHQHPLNGVENKAGQGLRRQALDENGIERGQSRNNLISLSTALVYSHHDK